MATRTGATLKRAKGREYLVQDRETFAAILEEAISGHYDGNRNAAAKTVGIPHSTLKRYMEKRGAAVRHETIERLRKLVGGSRVSRLEAALLSPPARRTLAEYDQWIRDATRSLAWGGTHGRRLLSVRDHLQLEAEVGSAFDRGTRLWQLIRRLQRQFPKEWQPLQLRITKRGHLKSRAGLAFLRVVEPLSAAEDTWGVERSWQELSDQEMREFIRAGVARERILLDRETDIRRAQDKALQMERNLEEIRSEGVTAKRGVSQKVPRATPVPPQRKMPGRRSTGRSLN